MFADTGHARLVTRDSAGITTALIGTMICSSGRMRRMEASGIQADRRGTEKPPNQKIVRTPGERIHQASSGKVRAETQQVPGLSVPGG